MPKLTINDQEIEVEAGTSILQAAEQLGIEIPRFCYHDRLSVPANCRMCLVELEGAPKLVASCAMAAGDNMIVRTDSEKVKKGRQGVMEMLLINHPLDCPICDQGGECDLQDQAVAYGYDRSRYAENKRAVKDKNLGPLIKTIMTRCINCTRCVRFGEEVAGVTELGQLNRGEDAEIGTFIEAAVTTEMSGNMIDICPVGALTSKPYAFTARPWELRKTESIDVHDGLGCNIRVDSRGSEVMRVLPRLNEEINEEWIDDRARFAYDGLKKNRIDTPYIRDSKTQKLHAVSWEEAFTYAADKLRTFKGSNMAAFVGDMCSTEEVIALKDLMAALGSDNLECRVDGEQFDINEKAGYLFNSTIAGIDEADAILLVGVNPRHEAAVLNARIRRNWLEKRMPVSVIGPEIDLTYPYYHAGTSIQDVVKMAKDHKGKVKAERPIMIIGSGVFAREDGAAVQAALRQAAIDLGCIKDDWNGYNVLHSAANRVGAMQVEFFSKEGFNPAQMGMVYLLNVDTPHVLESIHPQALVIYQGHHGDEGARRADIIFPGAAYTEKHGIYMNTEGRPQMAKKAVDAPGEAREDWRILRALSSYCNKALRYDDLFQIRERIVNEYPQFGLMEEVAVGSWGDFGSKGKLLEEDLKPRYENFYQTNVITRASSTMKACVAEFVKQEERVLEAAE